MKVKIIDENNIIVFFNTYLNSIDIMNKIEVENTIKNIIDKLNKSYKLNIYGYYNIDIYVDNYYGLIIKIQKEDIDYIDYEPGQIDMKIKIYDAIFLYKIDNIYNLDIDSSIYRYKDEYFLKLNNLHHMNTHYKYYYYLDHILLLNDLSYHIYILFDICLFHYNYPNLLNAYLNNQNDTLNYMNFLLYVYNTHYLLNHQYYNQTLLYPHYYL